jgi:hypothetical protein
MDFGKVSFHYRVYRYFQVDSTLGIHPIKLLVFAPLHQ